MKLKIFYMKKKNEKQKESQFPITEEEKKDFSKRLESLIPNRGLNEFAKNAGMAESTIRALTTGKSLPRLDNLITLANAAGVTVEWLATGRGSMTYQDSEDSSNDAMYKRQGAERETEPNEAPGGAKGIGHLISYDYAKALLDKAVALEYIPENNQWVVTDFINMYNSIVSLRDPDGAEEAVLKQLVIRIQRSIESLQTMLSSSMYDDNTKAALEEGLKINKHELAKMKKRLKDCTNRT